MVDVNVTPDETARMGRTLVGIIALLLLAFVAAAGTLGWVCWQVAKRFTGGR